MSRVYERENGQNPKTRPHRSWWLDAQTRDDFDRAVARESLRMRGMRADHDVQLESRRGQA